jgi:hypothetical protein
MWDQLQNFDELIKRLIESVDVLQEDKRRVTLGVQATPDDEPRPNISDDLLITEVIKVYRQ